MSPRNERVRISGTAAIMRSRPQHSSVLVLALLVALSVTGYNVLRLKVE
jgi:hypothetical protein